MSDLTFECQGCGNCCNRILIQYHDMTIGLALLPGEEKLFDPYPGAVKPYMGLRRMRGKGHTAYLLNYQMVQEPCPLYDKILKRCTRYEDRPMTCREYPLSHGTRSCNLEQHCTWVKSHDLVFGETTILTSPEHYAATIRINSFFLEIHDIMKRDRSVMVMFDVATDEWVIIK